MKRTEERKTQKTKAGKKPEKKPEKRVSRFDARLAQYYDELKWLYMELYNDEEAFDYFLKMLRSMKDFPCKVFNDANLKADRMNLYELFINMYLQEVRQILKQGLKSGYIEKEDNLHFYKGKLMVNEHIRQNLSHKERF